MATIIAPRRKKYDLSGLVNAMGNVGDVFREIEKQKAFNKREDARIAREEQQMRLQQQDFNRRLEEGEYKRWKEGQELIKKVPYMSPPERALGRLQWPLKYGWGPEKMQSIDAIPFKRKEEDVWAEAEFLQKQNTPESVRRANELVASLGSSAPPKKANQQSMSDKIYGEMKTEEAKKNKAVKRKELEKTEKDTFEGWEKAVTGTRSAVQDSMIPAVGKTAPEGYVRIAKKENGDIFAKTVMQTIKDLAMAGYGGGRSPIDQGVGDVPVHLLKIHRKNKFNTAWANRLRSVEINKLSEDTQEWIFTNGWPEGPGTSLTERTPNDILTLIEAQVKKAKRPPKEPEHLTKPRDASESYKNDQWYKNLKTDQKATIDKNISAGAWTVEYVKQRIRQ
ncbi:MAG: hypothetical protein ABIG61_07325 [Planctomycetota bacterium]